MHVGRWELSTASNVQGGTRARRRASTAIAGRGRRRPGCVHSGSDLLGGAYRAVGESDRGADEAHRHTTARQRCVIEIISDSDGVMSLQPGVMPTAPVSEYGGHSCALDYLATLDTLFVVQKIDLMELVTNYRVGSRFSIRNSDGEQVLMAIEESDMCQRRCCGKARAYKLHLIDNNNQEVAVFTRRLRCCTGCCWFGSLWGDVSEVEMPPGNVIGSISQTSGFCATNMTMRDAEGTRLLEVKGPCCAQTCRWFTKDKQFNVYSSSSLEHVGSIKKGWTGFVKEVYTNADMYTVNFPAELDTNMKIVYLGATFLANYMHFDRNVSVR